MTTLNSILFLGSLVWILGALLFLGLARAAAVGDRVELAYDECLDCGRVIEPARVRLGAITCAGCGS